MQHMSVRLLLTNRRLSSPHVYGCIRAIAEVDRLVGSQPDRLCSCCQEQLPASFFRLGSAYLQCRTCLTDKDKKRHGTKDYPPIAEKECSKCSKMLPGSAFNRDKQNSTGLGSRCKACTLAQVQANAASVKAAPLLPSGALGSKVCVSCAQTKLFTEFSIQSAKSDGHQSTCKQCSITYQRLRRGTRPVGQSVAKIEE